MMCLGPVILARVWPIRAVRSGLAERQGDVLHKAAIRVVADRQAAAEAAKDFARDGKAKACAGDRLLAGGIDAEERLEHPVDQVRWAGPAIRCILRRATR